MRLYKFVSEGVSVHDTDENIADMLHKECSQFFKETKGLRLFRGTSRNISVFEKMFPRSDRQSKDTPDVIHEYMDNLFNKKFGWKVRSEGVFVSTQAEISDQYGESYWFLPCNGYRYVYSPKYPDLTLALKEEDFISSTKKTNGKWSMTGLWDTELRDVILDGIISTYTDKNIKRISGTSTEISFHCPKGYYLINTGWMSDSNTRYFTIYGGH